MKNPWAYWFLFLRERSIGNKMLLFHLSLPFYWKMLIFFNSMDPYLSEGCRENFYNANINIFDFIEENLFLPISWMSALRTTLMIMSISKVEIIARGSWIGLNHIPLVISCLSQCHTFPISPSLTDNSHYVCSYYLAGTRRLINVEKTSFRRHDVEMTSFRRWLDVVCPLGKINKRTSLKYSHFYQLTHIQIDRLKLFFLKSKLFYLYSIIYKSN